MIRRASLLAALAASLVAMALAPTPAGADVVELLRLGPPADPGAPPAGWQPLTFQRVPRHTRYAVAGDGDRWAVWERTRYAAYRLLYGRYPPGRSADLGRWVTERRDVCEDYRRVGGGEPPAIEGIAVITDTDDTGESAVAWYDPIALGPAE